MLPVKPPFFDGSVPHVHLVGGWTTPPKMPFLCQLGIPIRVMVYLYKEYSSGVIPMILYMCVYTCIYICMYVYTYIYMHVM